MSSFASFVLSSVSTKAIFHPVVGCIVAGLQVASFVASTRPKAPDISVSLRSSGFRVPDATKTVLQPIDASIPLLVSLTYSFAAFGLLIAVLSIKGFFCNISAPSSHGSIDGRNISDDDPPEPDDGTRGGGSQDADSPGQNDETDTDTNGKTSGSEGPPPPPPPGTEGEAPRRRRNWFLRLLQWIFQLLLAAVRFVFSTLRLLYKSSWKTSIATMVVDLLSGGKLSAYQFKLLACVVNTQYFRVCVTGLVQWFKTGEYPLDGPYPATLSATASNIDLPLNAPILSRLAFCVAGYLEWAVTGALPLVCLHPIFQVIYDTLSGNAFILQMANICRAAVHICLSAAFLHLSLRTVGFCFLMVLWLCQCPIRVIVSGTISLCIAWFSMLRYGSRGVEIVLDSLFELLLNYIKHYPAGTFSQACGILSTQVEDLHPVANMVVVGVSLFIYACFSWGWPWNWSKQFRAWCKLQYDRLTFVALLFFYIL